MRFRSSSSAARTPLLDPSPVPLRCGPLSFSLLLAPLALGLGACNEGAAPEAQDAIEHAPPAARPVWFEECAEERGLVFRHVSGHSADRFLFPEIMGGGVALDDFDGDGDLDVYAVQSGSLTEADAESNAFFANDGNN